MDRRACEARIRSYHRRDPTETLLYRLLQRHLETFLDETSSLAHGLPAFVEGELRRFLECGLLAHGFVRVSCFSCQRDSLVAFSCKGRGFCPSCGGRRMSAAAAHWIDHVLPEVPIRQWVFTLPHALRLPCAFDHELCREVRRLFLETVFSLQARRARALGLDPGIHGFRTGAINVLQRFGGALNLNLHFHALVLDGVYTRKSLLGQAHFHPLPPPTQEQVEQTLTRLHRRLHRLLQRRAVDGTLPECNELLLHLGALSVQGRRSHLDPGQLLEGLFEHPPDPKPRGTKPLVASAGGSSLHAATFVPSHRRGRLEHLCRYVARPPLATERLSQDARGRILYRFRHPYSDGRTHAVFTVRGFLERLCALIPAPGTHQWTYHGVLAPASSWREAVVGGGTKAERSRDVSKKTLSLDRRLRWAELMKRTFEIDVLRCECGARRRVVGWVLERGVAVRILRHLGLAWEAPVTEPSRAPPVLEFGAR